MHLALHALQANWFRTLLTLLGIIIGVASVVSMMAIGESGKQQVLQGIEAMGTNLLQIRPGGRNIRSTGTIATLSMEDAKAIAVISGVVSIAPERGDRTTLRFGSHD
jgi:macrolide transport system ATP-binding/permease protein